MVINPAWLRWVRHFRVSPDWNQVVGWAGIFLYSLGKNLLSGSFWSLDKFSFLWLKDGGSLFSCLFSAGGLSQFKTSCILSHVDDSIFKPATVCQISMCCESPWFPLLLLARGNLLLLKGSPDWVGPIQIDSDFQINSLGASTIRTISSPQYLDLCLIEKLEDRNLGEEIFRILPALVLMRVMSIDDSTSWLVFAHTKRGLDLSEQMVEIA